MPSASHLQPRRPSGWNSSPRATLAENLADLPARGEVGCKRNRKGHPASWLGDKRHWDTGDGDCPGSAVLTRASVQASQVAIPLAQLTPQRVTARYDLMDRVCHAAKPRLWPEPGAGAPP